MLVRWAHQSANQFGLVLLGNGPRFDLSGATGWLAVFDIGSVVLCPLVAVMIAGDYTSNQHRQPLRHCYDDMDSATTVPTVVITAANVSRTPIQLIPKDLISLGEVIQRRPTNRADRRAMKRGKNGK